MRRRAGQHAGTERQTLKAGVPFEVLAFLEMGHEVISLKFNSIVAGDHSQVFLSSGLKHECLPPGCQCECGRTVVLSTMDSDEMARTHLTPA